MKRTELSVLMGAAAVAGLVLAGCSGAAGAAVDYAPALVGTWTRAAEAAELSIRIPGQTEEVKVPVQRSIAVTVTRTGTNAGTMKLAVTDAPDRDSADFPQLPAEFASLVPDSVETTATGTIKSTADVIKVTVSDVSPPSLPGVTLPAAGTAENLKGTTHRLAYQITGDKIALSGAALVLLNVTASLTDKLELTKQAGG